MAARQGPRLRVEGSCEGCAWLRHVERRYVGDEHTYRITICAHEKAQRNNAGEPMAMHDSGGPNRVAPSGCPELPGARLALARGIVAEACRSDGRHLIQSDAIDGPLYCGRCGVPLDSNGDIPAHGAGEESA